jgi:hypothetical protein
MRLSILGAIVALTLVAPNALAASPKPTPWSQKGVHMTDMRGRAGIVETAEGRVLVGKNGAMAVVYRNGKTIMYMDPGGRMMMLDAKGDMAIRDENGMQVKKNAASSAEGKRMLAEFHQLQDEAEAAK